jgi:MFS family permease
VSYIAEHSDKIYAFEGEVALILNYVVYLLGLSRAPSIRNFKRQFLIAAICYSTNYALYLLNFGQILGLLVSIVGAIVGGFGASVLWVSQGGYMMKVFKINQIEKNSEGYYMGILNGLVYGSSLFGAIIITFGLGLFGN